MRSAVSSNIVPRTTLDIDPTVLTDLRSRAATEGKSMGQVASELLAVGLHDETAPEQAPLRWARKDLGLKVNLEDKDAVWRILDADEFGAGDR
jgi:plasmid stability protein